MGFMETLCLEQAAKLLHISPDCLLRKARAGKVPGAKIGRRWVFVRSDLIELIRAQAHERANRTVPCLSTSKLRVPTGGSDSLSAERRLDAALALLTESKRT